MSINGISGHVSTPSVTTTPAAIIPPKPEAIATPQSQPYTVKLTGTALAKSLKLAGQNPAQIAQKMGVDVKTVDQYLGIKVAAATPALVATPAPEAKPAASTTPTAAPTPAEEAKEPASEKTAETAQGQK